MPRKILLYSIVLSMAFVPMLSRADWRDVPRGLPSYDGSVLLVPESERFLDFAVIGLWPNQEKRTFLPDMRWPAGAAKEQKEYVEEQLYWLYIILTHGSIFSALPRYTTVYVGLYDTHSLGNDRKYLYSFLKNKCGFTDGEITRRIRFFKPPEVLEWPQDIGEIIGYTADKKAVIEYSDTDLPIYAGTARALAAAYPEVFTLKKSSDTVSNEGGDTDLIWTPAKDIARLIGRNRILTYLRRAKGHQQQENTADEKEYKAAKEAYRAGFYGKEVITVPEKVLTGKAKGSDEVFHLDMEVSVLPDPKGGRPVAFVPECVRSDFYDSLSMKKFDDTYIDGLQAEYDSTAKQLSELGYSVARLPYADHPVRSPVNLIKYRDRVSGEYSVLLPKYPNQLPADDVNSPQAIVTQAFEGLTEAYDRWSARGGAQDYQQLILSIQTVWAMIDLAGREPNPVFDRQKKVLERYGYRVTTVPVLAWGAGGLHCQVLY